MGREGEVVRQLVPEFESRSGLQVRVQQIPWGAAHEKLLTAYVGETLPDVFQVGNTWIPELAALGALEPLDARMAGSHEVERSDYFSGILDTNVIEDVTFGVPWYVDTRVWFVRRDLLAAVGLDKMPSTWEGCLDAFTRLQQRAPTGGHAILLPLSEWQMPVILAFAHDAPLLREHDTYGAFRSPGFRAAFEQYLRFFRSDLAPPAGAAQAANIYQDFASGHFAAFVSGPWNLEELRARLPLSLAEQWTTAAMPGGDANLSGPSVAGGSSLVLSAASPHQAAAWQWIEYLSEPAIQRRFYELSGDLPPRRSSWDSHALRDDARAQAFARQLLHVRSTPKIPEWERIASRITQYAEAAVRGQMTVEEALAALDADTDAILEKRRWMLAQPTRRP